MVVPLLLVVVGFAALATGLGFYDWRIAAIVTGLVLIVVGLFVEWEDR